MMILTAANQCMHNLGETKHLTTMAVAYFLISLFCAFSLLTAVRGYEFTGEWGPWTPCTAECDGGKQTREKVCDGQVCGRVETSCHLMSCENPFRNIPWSGCSEQCGPDGVRTRSNSEGDLQEIRCNTQSCEPSEGDCVGDVVFVLDSSGSIGFLNWSVSKQFVIDVMKGLKVSSEGTHVSVVIYSTEVETCFSLTAYYTMDEIEPIVFNLEYMAGVTNTADGIMVMHQILKDQGRGADVATPIGVVITDGASNVDKTRTIPEAKSAQDDGIQMFAVAIGEDIDMDEINGIASNEDYVFHASNYGQVQDLTKVIADKICSTTPRKECGPCGDYGGCSESCGKEGIKEGTMDCWLVNGVTGQEIPSTRHKELCTDTCFTRCPERKCGLCGEYGPCSESCGADGTKTGTKDCWMKDGDTGIEIPGSRHPEECNAGCYIPCPKRKCGPCGEYGPCSESCGAEGIAETTRDCWLEDGETGIELPGSRHEEPCTEPCFITCPTTTTEQWVPDCSRCDYTNGQIWLQDRNNCHMYFVCEPLGNGEYRIHHVTCGELFWNQDYHTCVPVMPADVDCVVGPVNLYPEPSTPGVPCPYEPYPGDPSKFWVSGDPLTVSVCLQGMEFVNMGDLCDCLPAGPLIPKCEDDLLLYFPYEDHYNDVTCHQAIATQYGNGVSLQFDPERNGNVACFTGGTHFEVAFLRTWFANNKVDKFTVSVWFKRQGEQFTPQGIVNNGDCIDTAGFLIGHAERTVMANITTEDARAQFPVSEVSDDCWHHVVWVYDGLCLKVYVDDRLEKTIPITGYLKNNDVPMYIANCCGEHFFTGCLDELRVYNRVLSPAEIEGLP
ncbi:hypothetical protein LSAT2_007248 [Lamellibrachia satsuma]|nr:hypothetical protein LSAT2_007248 [Lamellibrachia satsuma]